MQIIIFTAIVSSIFWLFILIVTFLKWVGKPASEKILKVGQTWKILCTVENNNIKYVFVEGPFSNGTLRIVGLTTKTMKNSIKGSGTYGVNLNMNDQKSAVRLGDVGW